MKVEELTKLFLETAEESISAIKEIGSPLTDGQTDALGDVRSDLRDCLRAISKFSDDLPEKEAISFIGVLLKWDPENSMLEQVCRDSGKFDE